MGNTYVKPWWLAGLHCLYLCVWWAFLFQFFSEENVLLTVPLVIIGFLALFFFGRFVYDFIKQHAQYTIKSILLCTLCVASFSSIYACFGLGGVLYFLTAFYFWLIALWYWKNFIE